MYYLIPSTQAKPNRNVYGFYRARLALLYKDGWWFLVGFHSGGITCIPPPPLCASTEWALNHCFAWTFGTSRPCLHKGGGMHTQTLHRDQVKLCSMQTACQSHIMAVMNPFISDILYRVASSATAFLPDRAGAKERDCVLWCGVVCCQFLWIIGFGCVWFPGQMAEDGAASF